MQNFANAVKSLIADNRTKAALAVLIDFLKNKDNQLYNTCLLLQSNLLNAERDYSLGMLSPREAEQSTAKVKMALLQTVDEVATMQFDDGAAMIRGKEVITAFNEAEFNPKQKAANRRRMFWVAILAVALLAALVIGFMLKSGLKDVADRTVSASKALTAADTAALVAGFKKDAETYYKQQNFTKSLEAINQAIALQGDNAEFYNTRANIYFHLNQMQLAHSDAKRAVVLNSNDCWIYATLAQIATRQNNTEEFYKNITESLKKHCDIWNYTQQPGIVEHAKEKRFLDLIAAYKE